MLYSVLLFASSPRFRANDGVFRRDPRVSFRTRYASASTVPLPPSWTQIVVTNCRLQRLFQTPSVTPARTSFPGTGVLLRFQIAHGVGRSHQPIVALQYDFLREDLLVPVSYPLRYIEPSHTRARVRLVLRSEAVVTVDYAYSRARCRRRTASIDRRRPFELSI